MIGAFSQLVLNACNERPCRWWSAFVRPWPAREASRPEPDCVLLPQFADAIEHIHGLLAVKHMGEALWDLFVVVAAHEYEWDALLVQALATGQSIPGAADTETGAASLT